MDQKLKERLIGVIVLVSLAVIFIPLFLTEPVNLIQEDKKNSSSSEDSEFVSKLKPIAFVINKFLINDGLKF